jgi:AP-5 complex subunit mu-1
MHSPIIPWGTSSSSSFGGGDGNGGSNGGGGGGGGDLWPVMYLRTDFGAILVGIPVVENIVEPFDHHQQHEQSSSPLLAPSTPHTDLPLLNLPCISSTIKFLQSFAELVHPTAPRFEQTRMAELHLVLSRMLQFGRVSDLSIHNAQLLLKHELGSNHAPPQSSTNSDTEGVKLPAWRLPGVTIPKTKATIPRLDVQIKESLFAVQYDRENVPDEYFIQGNVHVTAEHLDGYPELNLTVFLAGASPDGQTVIAPVPLLYDITYHHSVVQTSAASTSSSLSGVGANSGFSGGNSSSSNIIKMQFHTPLHPFVACKYSARRTTQHLPIRGFYQMKDTSPTHTKILIQLKLAENTTNQFEYCDVEIPFPNKTLIRGFELQPTQGSVAIDQRRRNVLVWTIGPKITSRNLEVSLPGTVVFAEEVAKSPLLGSLTQGPSSSSSTVQSSSVIRVPSQLDNLMGEDAAGHIRLRFRLLDWTASGATTNATNIFVYPKPSGKPLVPTISRVTDAVEYVIWNSSGNVRSAQHPERTIQRSSSSRFGSSQFQSGASAQDRRDDGQPTHQHDADDDSGTSSSDVDSD